MDNFQAAIDKFNRKAVHLSQSETVKIGLGIENDAAGMTPVLTGRLRNGWSSDIDKARNGEVTVTVQNPVEYARYVEEGSEQRRPARMLARAIERAKQRL